MLWIGETSCITRNLGSLAVAWGAFVSYFGVSEVSVEEVEEGYYVVL